MKQIKELKLPDNQGLKFTAPFSTERKVNRIWDKVNELIKEFNELQKQATKIDKPRAKTKK